MAVTTDMMRTWRAPRAVMRKLLDQGRREDRALAYLMISCFLIFVAQWPRLSRINGGFEPSPFPADVNFEGMMTYTFFSLVVMMPLVFYALAAASHVLAKLFRGRGTWYGARLALFWTLLATTPLTLLFGLVRGFFGPGQQTMLVGGVWLVIFAYIWLQSLRESESGQ